MRKYLLFLFLWLSIYLPALAQQPAWEEQNAFVNGYARVFHQDKFSFINTGKQLICPFAFEDARNFYHQLAAVKQQDKWGFINENGKIIIPCSYDIVFDFREDVTVVSTAGKWWLINMQGKIIQQPDISLCEGFQNGSAIVYQNGNRGSMDKNGNIVFEKKVAPLPKAIIPYTPSLGPNTCPDNLDFEFGNFTNWRCFTGRVDSVGNTNVITVNPSPPTPGRHTIYARVLPSPLDPFGLFPINPPDGSNFAVKLGNTNVGAQAERIQYVIHVPLNDSNFSFRYHYSVVLQDPGHTAWTQPRFTAKLLDSATNTYIDCASFEYISTSNLPGFMHSTVDTSVIYKPWSPVFISLRGYAGKTLYLEFTTADCVRRAHWGYAYVDVQDLCGQAIQVNYQCDTPHVTTLTGPPGFQFYNWWNQNFTTLLGTGQTITLNPGPPPNTLFWLEVIPFTNFGCLDTIPIRVHGTTTAHFDATDTLGICAPHTFTFYNRNLPSVSAIWNFGDGNTGTGDTVTHTYNLPGTYIVTLSTTDSSTCTGIAVDTVRVIQPSGSFTYTGGSFCSSHAVTFTATTSYIDSLFWDFGDGTFLNTTLTTVTHTYSLPGIYFPRLRIKSNAGCQFLLPGVDTVKIEKLAPGYTSNIQPFCTFTTITLTDTSYSYFGIGTRTWYFSDGTTATGNTVTHTYTTTGTYSFKLVITGVTGCKDSVTRNIYIKVNDLPVANIIGDTTACVNSAITFFGTVVSSDPVGSLYWSCSNGTNGLGNPFTVIFNNAGTFTVDLIASTIYGCKDTVTRTIHINPLPAATISGPATVCVNAPSPLITFTGSGGTAPYSFFYSINGGPNQAVTTSVGNSVTVAAPTNVAGTFVYTLIRVQDGSSTACSQLQNGSVIIKVNPLPTASISGPATVCLNAPSPLVTLTGAGSTAPYTFTYHINNGPDQTITTTSGNSITLPVPTNVAGSFTYTLVRVQDGSSTACSQLQNGSVTITVNPLPTASISGPATVCLNAPSPLVSFTGAGGTAPYTFTYRINSGPNQTITTSVGNSVTIAAPTNITGSFTYTLISVQDGSATACSQLQNGSVIITVNPLPAASISGPATVCLNAPSPLVTFTGSGSTAPYTFTYNINGGPNQTVTTTSGNSVTVAAPTNVAGTFTYNLVSVRDGSSTACSQLQPGAVIITVNPLPSASISGPATVCLNAPSPSVTFTGAGGTAPYTFTYTLNGGPNQTITTTSGNSVSITVPTNVAGTFTYTLISVQDASSTACSQLQNGSVVITVNPLPTANINGPAEVCLNAPSPLITFTGSGGSAPYTFTYNINGGPNQTVTTTSGNSATVSVPTNIATTYTYTLISVQDGSSTTCSQLQNGSVVVTVNPLPTAGISGPATVCLNAPSPLVTFTGAGSTAPYTFTYNINGGPNQTITTTSGNSVTLPVPTNVAGTFTYTLVSVQDGSSTTCSQLQIGSVVITVNPLPTATISGSSNVCLNAPSPMVTFTGANATAPYTFTYNINGGPNQTISTTTGNSISLPVPTTSAGTFTYTLISVKDGSSTGCSQLQNGTAVITVNPLPTAGVSGDATVCMNAPAPSVIFTAANGTAPYTFTYTINGGPNQTISTTTGNSVNLPVSTAIAGTYTYTLVSVQSGSSGCGQLQNGVVIIKVNPLPTAAIGGPASVCINAASPSIMFTGANGIAPYTFVYRINGGAPQSISTTTGNTATLSVPTNIAGTFTYTLVSVQESSSTACSQLQNGSVVVTVSPPPLVNAGNDRGLCQGSAVQLTVTGAAQYTWSPSTGLSCTNCANPIASPADTTEYIVKGTNAFGCVAYDTIKVLVIKPFPMFASPNDTICAGQFVVLNARGADRYLWSPATGLDNATISTPRASPTSTTTYRVIGYDGYGCFSDTAFIKITVGPQPAVDAGADLTLATGDVVTLNPILYNGPVIKWLWEPATYLSCNNCPTPQLTVHDNITYTVTVTNQYGCVASDIISINTFCKSSQVFVPNAFTPDGDGLNDVLMVRGKGIHVVYFRVFSRWGELVFEKKDFAPNDPKFGWDGRIRGVPAPPDVFVYTAQVVCDNNVLQTIKGNTTILK